MLGIILVVILVLFLLGGLTGPTFVGGYGYGYGHAPNILLFIVIIVVVIWLVRGGL